MNLESLTGFFTGGSLDWFILAGCAGVLALDAVRSGPARAAALALSLPVALFLSQAITKAVLLGTFAAQFATPAGQLTVLAVVFVLAYICTYKMIASFSNGVGALEALIAGLGATVVLVVVFLEITALGAIWQFGDQVQAIFGAAYRFWWLIAAYLGLAFVRS